MVKKPGIGGSKKAKNKTKDIKLALNKGALFSRIKKHDDKKAINVSSVHKAKAIGFHFNSQQKSETVRGVALKSFADKLAFWRSFSKRGAKGGGALQSDNVNKNRKRNWHIALYAAAGFVAVVVLLIVLVPGGEAASIQVATLVDSPEATVSQTADPTEAPTGRKFASVDDTPIETAQAPIETTVSEPTAVPTTEAPMVMAAAPIETTPPDATTTPIDINDLVEDFRVEEKLYYNKMGYSSNHYEYTENEMYMLAQIIQSEAGGESFDGKVAVGNVVMNRVLLHGWFGSTITAVVTADSQFAYNQNKTPSRESKRAARSVLDYENWVVPQNVYFFHSARPAGEDWGSHKFYTKLGGHCFYTHRYYGRSRVDSVPPALFERTYQWPQLGCKPEDRVYRVQYMLNTLGYDVYADKYFGQDSEDAIKAFQENKGLDADGVAGPSTIEALINAFGLVEYYQKFCM